MCFLISIGGVIGGEKMRSVHLRNLTLFAFSLNDA